MRAHGNADADLRLLPARLVMDEWSEPDYSAEDGKHEAPKLLGATLVASRLRAGARYALLRYANASLVPSGGDFVSNRTGGVVERMEVMSMVPEDLGSRFTTMTILLVMMVLVGMTMDALGAVVLVSVTIAPLAYNNGIDPVHFWMMVLVAFELGYLTPPVALNQLLTRAVVGPEATVPPEEQEGGFFSRHQHILLPVAVMATVLVLVAYVPLFFY